MVVHSCVLWCYYCLFVVILEGRGVVNPWGGGGFVCELHHGRGS